MMKRTTIRAVRAARQVPRFGVPSRLLWLEVLEDRLHPGSILAGMFAATEPGLVNGFDQTSADLAIVQADLHGLSATPSSGIGIDLHTPTRSVHKETPSFQAVV